MFVPRTLEFKTLSRGLISIEEFSESLHLKKTSCDDRRLAISVTPKTGESFSPPLGVRTSPFPVLTPALQLRDLSFGTFLSRIHVNESGINTLCTYHESAKYHKTEPFCRNRASS